MSRSFMIMLGVLGGAVLVLVVLPVLAGSGLLGSGLVVGPGGMMGGWGGFGMGWMMLFPLLFFGCLIAMIVGGMTHHGSGGHDASMRHHGHAAGSPEVHEHSAEETLRQRFARGEIDAEEYEQRHRTLREQSPAAHR
jgi:putative membrane protein